METQNKKDCMDILGTSGAENRIDQVRGWGKKALGETTRIWELFRGNVQAQYYRHSENFTKYILGKIPKQSRLSIEGRGNQAATICWIIIYALKLCWVMVAETFWVQPISN